MLVKAWNSRYEQGCDGSSVIFQTNSLNYLLWSDEL